MSDYAKINSDDSINNIIVADADFISKQRGEWIKITKSNLCYRDGNYNRTLKKFIKPKPHRSWVLDNKGIWQPPTPIPSQDPQLYDWDEPTRNWKVRRNKKPEFQ